MPSCLFEICLSLVAYLHNVREKTKSKLIFKKLKVKWFEIKFKQKVGTKLAFAPFYQTI